MAAVLDEVGKSAEKLVNEEKDEIVDEEDKTGAAEASKKKKKKKKKKKAGAFCSSIVFKRRTGLKYYTSIFYGTRSSVDDLMNFLFTSW